MTEARNQMPTTLLFRDGALIDRKLGAQSFETLRDWVMSAAEKK
jgi:thioredoxin-like negative regulator of GroEL